MMDVESYVVSNSVTLGLVLACVWVARVVGREPIWRDAARQLWSRRRLAIVVVALYMTIGLVDSIAWKGGIPEDVVDVLPNAPLTLLDRAFLGTKEASYSAPFASVEFYGAEALKRPGQHPFGTDILGRDVLYLSLKGARVALLIGGLTSLIAIPLALIMAMGRGTLSVCIALGVTSWVGFCRLTRAETLKLRELDYVSAARALGVPELRIVIRHILPNLAHLIVITFVLMFSGLVLSEAVLAWLGIGVDGSWGQMIDGARDELSRDPIIWWNLSASGAALFVLILAVNSVGDAIRDVLDPRTLKDSS